MIKIVIDICENKKNVAKHHTYCRIIYDKFNDKMQNKQNNKKFSKFYFCFEIILIQIRLQIIIPFFVNLFKRLIDVFFTLKHVIIAKKIAVCLSTA